MSVCDTSGWPISRAEPDDVHRILAKLGARSRVEIAREAAHHAEPPRPQQQDRSDVARM
jgi:hypothetical protein